MMLKRFFGTSAILRRIPPGAPAHVKEIPVPRTAKSTAEIHKHVQPHPEEVTDSNTKYSEHSATFLKSVFPSANTNLQLNNPEGVWYHIERSRSGNLPVYTDYNNAGGVWTEVRKISGNVGAFRNDLKKALDIPKANIWVKNAAQVVVIKGNHSAEVKKLLATVF